MAKICQEEVEQPLGWERVDDYALHCDARTGHWAMGIMSNKGSRFEMYPYDM
jgi:hypothetical protein